MTGGVVSHAASAAQVSKAAARRPYPDPRIAYSASCRRAPKDPTMPSCSITPTLSR